MLRNARYLSARETKYSFVKLEQIFYFNHEQEGLDLEMKLAWRRVSECPRLQTLCKNLTTLNQTLIAEGDCDIIREGVKSIKKVFMESVCKGGSLSPPSLSFKRMCNNVKTMSREDFKYEYQSLDHYFTALFAVHWMGLVKYQNLNYLPPCWQI